MNQRFKMKPGFSLVELLIAISILAVVTTIGLQAFALLTGNWREKQAMTRLNGDANAVFREIERDITDTLSAELSGIAIRGYDSFSQGDGFNVASDHDDRIVIPVQDAASGRTLKNARSVQWRVLRDDSGRNALYRTIGTLGSANPSNSRTDFIPNTNVVRFDITYGTGEAGSPWVASWDSEGHPKAVRVSMTLSNPNYPFRQISRKEVYTVHVR